MKNADKRLLLSRIFEKRSSEDRMTKMNFPNQIYMFPSEIVSETKIIVFIYKYS